MTESAAGTVAAAVNAEVNKQLKKQMITAGHISNFLTNSKKNVAQIDRTTGYLRVRITLLKSYWDKFTSQYDALADFSPNEIADRYVASTHFNKIEDDYIHACANLQDEVDSLNRASTADLNTTVQDFLSTTPRHLTPQQPTRLPQLAIPKFTGNYLDWPAFKDIFKSLITDNTTITDVQKLQYLKANIGGEAAALTENITVTAANFPIAWKALETNYENNKIVVNMYLKQITAYPALSKESATDMKQLMSAISNSVQALTNLGRPTDHWDDFLVFITVEKLDGTSRKEWEDSINKSNDLPEFKTLEEFIRGRIRTLEALGITESSPAKSNVQQSRKSVDALTSHHITENTKKCPMCTKGRHILAFCFNFRRKPVDQRNEFVVKNSLCHICLQSSHKTEKCTTGYSCKQCGAKHNTLLHKNTTDTEPKASTSNVSVHFVDRIHKTSQVLLATAWIRAESSDGSKLRLRALLDQGSQASFISESAVRLLKLSKRKVCIPVAGLSSAEMVTATAEVKVKFSSCYSGNENFIINALVIKKLSNSLPGATIHPGQWDHLIDIELADPEYFASTKVDVLLGADVYGSLLRDGIRTGSPFSPIGQNTALGWILSGRVRGNDQANSNVIFSHHTTVDDDLNELLRKFWEIENGQQTAKFTDDEALCETHFQSTVQRSADGRYTVRLPIKDPNGVATLGDSRRQAVACLLSLEKKFNRDPVYAKRYKEFMYQYLQLGHMKIAPSQPENNMYYIPHHGVVKESSLTTKLRVVFNASKPTTSGSSLNSHLHVGPKLQNDLVVIMLRWRTNRFVFVADIEKMYRQILVDQRDTDLQRIVWRESSDEDIKDYCLQTITYGTTCAPYLAIRTLKQLIADETENFPEAAKILNRDSYVDDILSGAEDFGNACRLQDHLISLLHSGGFQLKKWLANDPRLIDRLPSDVVATESSMCFAEDSDGIKTLGILWYPSSDQFGFSVNSVLGTEPYTKRKILSDAFKIYDPVGWLAPVVVRPKMMIQQLWLESLNWDDPVKEQTAKQWNLFKKELPLLETLRIDRYINTDASCSIEIHGFCDASTVAYAGVVYVRVTFADNSVAVYNIGAKSKVAPVKQVSLPRLELCGAVLLKCLFEKIIQSFDVRVPIYAWTDSTVVLAWLRGHPIRWKPFVANRVSDILGFMNASQWQHVQSADNPADCASRGISVQQLLEHSLWWTGPSWLKDNQWRTNISKNNKQFETCVEAKTIRKCFNYTFESFDLINRYSSLDKLLRVTAFIRRFIYNSRGKSARILDWLTSTELRQATIVWARITQHANYLSEIHTLQNRGNIKSSKLIKLVPFLDSDEVLRVRGRLSNANLSYEERHPIILPADAKFTQLLIAKSHKLTLHGGTQLTLAHLRSKWWIVGGRNAVKKYIHKCVVCVRHRKKTEVQIMADLPFSRVNPNRPFLHSGIDYAGPIQIRTNKGRGFKAIKAYIAVFICFVTKAAHLEIVSDQTSHAFIAAFKRFVSRRGICTNLYSDRGTNFVGACNELRNALQMATDGEARNVVDYLNTNGTNWHFNPPGAPHFSGLCEAAVKSSKAHLKRIIGTSTLTFEEMATLLAQVEACLNSRPISPMTDDAEDLQPLTPGHFLVGHPLCTVPEPSLVDINPGRLSRWQTIQQMYQTFWKRWSAEYLHILQQRHKWNTAGQNVQKDDLVLIRDERAAPCHWPLGRVLDVHPGDDEQTRVLTLRCQNGTMKRPIVKVVVLPISDQ